MTFCTWSIVLASVSFVHKWKIKLWRQLTELEVNIHNCVLRVYWNTISPLQLPLFLSKNHIKKYSFTALSPVSIWSDYLYKYKRIAIDHIGSLKCPLLESYKEFPDWALISPTGWRSQATKLPSGFAFNIYNFGWVPQVLKVPQMSWGSSLPPPRKAVFTPYLDHKLLGTALPGFRDCNPPWLRLSKRPWDHKPLRRQSLSPWQEHHLCPLYFILPGPQCMTG